MRRWHLFRKTRLLKEMMVAVHLIYSEVVESTKSIIMEKKTGI